MSRLEFEEYSPVPQDLASAVAWVSQTPTGYAYVKTAVLAAYMRIGLGYAWDKYGKKILSDVEALIESESKKNQAANAAADAPECRDTGDKA